MLIFSGLSYDVAVRAGPECGDVVQSQAMHQDGITGRNRT